MQAELDRVLDDAFERARQALNLKGSTTTTSSSSSEGSESAASDGAVLAELAVLPVLDGLQAELSRRARPLTKQAGEAVTLRLDALLAGQRRSLGLSEAERAYASALRALLQQLGSFDPEVEFRELVTRQGVALLERAGFSKRLAVLGKRAQADRKSVV